MKVSGIYKIQSKVKPERIYIGSAVDIKSRWRIHKHHLRMNKHHSLKLQRHYDKYGVDDLQFSILLVCEKEGLIANEQLSIDSLSPYFNACKVAGSRMGVKHTEETKKKMQGRVISEETKKIWSRQRIGRAAWNKGLKLGHNPNRIQTNKGKKIHSEDYKRSLSKRMSGNLFAFGYKATEEQRKKNSEGHRGKKNYLFGKHLTDETKRKLSLSHLGQVSGNKGNKYSEETKRKLSELHRGKVSGMKGKHHTEEARKKMSNALKGRSAWNKGKRGIYSVEQINKWKELRKGRHHTKETKDKIRLAIRNRLNKKAA